MQQPFQSKSQNNLDFIFQPCQIVCLEHSTVRLYAEVIQMADSKKICWVRPLAMVEENREGTDNFWLTHSSEVQDLRQSSDLLLPSALFRSALDTEVIPILSQFNNLIESQNKQDERSQDQLREFIRDVCLARPELF